MCEELGPKPFRGRQGDVRPRHPWLSQGEPLQSLRLPALFCLEVFAALPALPLVPVDLAPSLKQNKTKQLLKNGHTTIVLVSDVHTLTQSFGK